MAKHKQYSFSKLYFALTLLAVVFFIGIGGFMFISHYTLIEAFYMTVITISTVGYGEIHPLSAAGRIFTAFLIIGSFGTFAYAITALTNYAIDGNFRRYYKYLRHKRQLKRVKNYTIICGYGRNGKQAAREFLNSNRSFIVIENDPQEIELLHGQKKITFIEGDATNEDTLIDAGIAKAQSLITTLPKDADNLFVVLTARELNKDLLIVSRASDDNSDKKLKRAGANNVIMPDKIGGAHMASLVIKPDVVEFFDYILGQETGRVNLEELSFEHLPEQLQNKTIKELNIRNKSGANVVGFKTASGEYIINPSADTKIIPDAKIFVLGTPEQIKSFRSLISD